MDLSGAPTFGDMADTAERECHQDDCPREGIWEVDGHPGIYLCNQCHDEHLMNTHLWMRQWRADNSPTKPTGDPGEAMHGGGAA